MNTPERAPLSISLNGVDNVGKTTQLRWLDRFLPNAQLIGKIDAWEPRWAEVAAGDFARWWFADSTTEEHVELTFCGHAARRAASGSLALEDRGAPMLVAACAATAAVKENLGPAAALERVGALLGTKPQASTRPELHVLLRRFADPEDEAKAALEREAEAVSPRYRAYQQHLAAVVGLQAEQRAYDLVLTVADQPILDIQQRLRIELARHGIDTDPVPADVIERLWVLGGLSESGKSTVGELLRSEHSAARLKIGYLLEIAAARAGVTDPYQWAETEQAERLSDELLRYAEANKASFLSIESAHRYNSTAHLKRIWGTRATVVYVDAPEATRIERSSQPPGQVQQKDAIKWSRGADRIAGIADLLIDNSQPLSALKTLLVQQATGPAETIPHEWEPQTNLDWLRTAARHLVDEGTALVLATGSTGTDRWRADWSDVDLLVVRDTLPMDWLRERVPSLPASNGIKVGLSAFTTSDLTGRRVPPRVLHALRHGAAGEGVLYRREGYGLPAISSAEDDRASRAEMGLVLMTSRRLLAAESTGLRDLFKHLVLLAKITLRADGFHADDADTVLDQFRRLHPGAACTTPTLDELLNDPDQTLARERVAKDLDGVMSYLDQLGSTARSLR